MNLDLIKNRFVAANPGFKYQTEIEELSVKTDNLISKTLHSSNDKFAVVRCIANKQATHSFNGSVNVNWTVNSDNTYYIDRDAHHSSGVYLHGSTLKSVVNVGDVESEAVPFFSIEGDLQWDDSKKLFTSRPEHFYDHASLKVIGNGPTGYEYCQYRMLVPALFFEYESDYAVIPVVNDYSVPVLDRGIYGVWSGNPSNPSVEPGAYVTPSFPVQSPVYPHYRRPFGITHPNWSANYSLAVFGGEFATDYEPSLGTIGGPVYVGWNFVMIRAPLNLPQNDPCDSYVTGSVGIDLGM